jgi:hypothetical protein
MTSGAHWRLPSSSIPGPIGWVIVALASFAVVLLGLNLPEMLGVKIDPALTIMALPLGAAMVYLVWCRERYWVFLALLSHLLIMVDPTPDTIGFGELMFAVLGLAGLIVWFVKEVGVHRRRIVNTGFDLLLASFLVVGTISTAIACGLNGGDFLQYAKEYVPIIDLLFYFPLRKVTNERRDVVIILVLFVFVGLVNGAVGFATYRERLAAAVFQWQVTSSRTNFNESTSLALFILASTFFAYSNKLWLRLVALGLSGAGLVFLLISFSRSPIVSAVVALIIMMVLSPWRNGRRVVLALVAALVVGVGVAYIMFPQIASSIGAGISERVLSVASTASDRSFNARLVEAGTIMDRYFRYSPIIGCGFGVSFKFLDPLTQVTVTVFFVHNGYIWSLFKYGVPLAVMLLGLMMYPLVRLFVVAPARTDGFNRALMAGAAGYMVCAFMVHFTSNLFTQVSTILNIVICWVIFDYVQRQARAAQPMLAALSVPVDPRRGEALVEAT